MDIKVQKWGNSLAVRIPKAYAANTNLQKGSTLNIALNEGNNHINPCSGKRIYPGKPFERCNPQKHS